MGAHKLESIFNPKRIALIGVTTNPNSVGGKVLQNLVGGGFSGVVYPVNPDCEAVLGIQCYPNLKSVPRPADLAVICTAAALVPGLVRQCGEAGVLGIVILSAGFRETGPEGLALELEIKRTANDFPGLRILGPNCLGLILPGSRFNLSFAAGMPQAGSVAFLSQSGALCTSVLDWALAGKIGFSAFVSVGNALDIGFAELIDYLGEDDNTQSIILYIESLTQARRFMTAARAFARGKPIIAYKAGRFAESAAVAASHTGAMASEDAIYDAAFQRIGLARVFDFGEIFDCVELIGRNRLPAGPRLGIVTNAGGPGVIASDALIAAGGTLAKLSDTTMAALNEALPPAWSHCNPVDVLGDSPAKRFDKAARLVVEDPGVDALMVILTPQAMTNPTATAKTIGKLAETTAKPILATWLGGIRMRDGIPILVDGGIAVYRTPDRAVRAFMTLVAYARNLRTLYETPKDIPILFPNDRSAAHTAFVEAHFNKGTLLGEDVAKLLLESYGIPTTRPEPVDTADQAVQAAERIGYPVVVKLRSPDVTHKTDVGGVALGLEDAAMVRGAFERVLASARSRLPHAQLEGATVQPMRHAKHAVELIVGIKKDPVFGTVMLAGMGGIAAELLGDRALGFPPLNERLAMRMLESLKIWPLLNGFRGQPRLRVDKLVEVLIRLSYLAADYPEVAELDINPLLVTPEEIVALDARIVVDRAAVGRESEPYAHLALRPYPESYVKEVTLKDGARVTLRPIKPEDEPLWLALLASCSKESLYSRFRYQFHWNSHEVATRFCYIDYDREIAIVAEVNEGNSRKLVGVGRLIADPDHESVEYAVLIADAWQNKELGSILTDYCLEVAGKWKLKRIVAQTTTDNRAMLTVFQHRDFTIEAGEAGLVEVMKELR